MRYLYSGRKKTKIKASWNEMIQKRMPQLMGIRFCVEYADFQSQVWILQAMYPRAE